MGRACLVAVGACVSVVPAVMAPATAPASPEVIAPGAKMLAAPGKAGTTKMKALSLGGGRVAYLRFRVPAGWRRSSLMLGLEPQAASAGVTVRRVLARWAGGKVRSVSSSRSAPTVTGPALLPGVRSVVDVSSQLTPGRTQTLELSSGSGRVAIASIPVLEAAAPAQVAAVGDIACSPSSAGWNAGLGDGSRCGQDRVAGLVQDPDEKVLLLGDNQYPAGSLADYQAGFGRAWASLAGRLTPIPGNHDYLTGQAAGYFDYFASIGVRTGERGQGWYAYDLGNWRVIALNTSDRCRFVACDAGSDQELWLRSELIRARAAGRCTLAYWHHPRVSGSEYGDNAWVEALWRDMYELGGDVVLNGHDHNYQRFDPLDADGRPAADGPREWVVGTGGFTSLPARERPGSARVITDTFGLLRLKLLGNSYAWQWAGVAGAGSDSGSASCRG